MDYQVDITTGYEFTVNIVDEQTVEVEMGAVSFVTANIAATIHGAASKTTPADADELGIWNSVTSTLYKLTFANLKTWLTSLYVGLTGNQTVAGIKTFSSSPIVPAPTTDLQAATKKYVDDNSGGLVDSVNGETGTVVLDQDDIGDGATYTRITPAEKSTYNGKQDALGFTPENVANKATAFQVTPDNTKYPTEKLVKDSLDGKSDTGHNHSGVYQPVGSYEVTTNKDATGGYVGLTLFKINFKNALNTITSFFTNSNTVARTYTFQDRDGTIADDTDLAGKENTGVASGLVSTHEGTYNHSLIANAFQKGTDDLDDISEGITNKHFTSTEQTKLAGIATGAEVNVNADWNSGSGDSQILNKPTIPTTAVWVEVKTYTIQGEIKVAVGDTDVLPPFSIYEDTNDVQTLIGWEGSIGSGTSATLKLQASNGSGGAFGDITGFTGFAISGGYTNPSSSDPADYGLTNGEIIQPVVTAVSGTPKNLSLNLFIKHTITLT